MFDRLRPLLAVTMLASVVACIGGDEGSECRAEADCAAELVCLGPSEPSGCGVPPQEGCSSDADCGAGAVCHAIPDNCSLDGIGSECRPACAEQGCGEGFVCDPGRGACVTIPCGQAADAAYVCPSWQACEAVDPSAPIHAQTHGCVAIPCEDDGPCASGDVCVNGICQDAAGTCGPVELTP